MRKPSDGDRNRRQSSDLPPIDSPETFPGWHWPWPRFEVDWTRAALVVVDVQNYGCNVDAGLGPMLTEHFPEIARYYLPRVTQTVVPNAVRLLDAFRATGRRVVFTRHGPLLPDGSDMTNTGRTERTARSLEPCTTSSAGAPLPAPTLVTSPTDRAQPLGTLRMKAYVFVR
jgi:nicotinamidase-related amidase